MKVICLEFLCGGICFSVFCNMRFGSESLSSNFSPLPNAFSLNLSAHASPWWWKYYVKLANKIFVFHLYILEAERNEILLNFLLEDTLGKPVVHPLNTCGSPLWYLWDTLGMSDTLGITSGASLRSQ